MHKRVNLKSLFLSLQKQMLGDLEMIGEHIDHPGEKGDATEINWIDWMREYLPKRYCVDKAFVIDCEGNCSQQIDIVIYDRQYSPFVFKKNGIYYIPAESVYAVFEVKQELNKDYLEYAAKKIASVRVLRRTSAKIVHVEGEYSKPKKLFKILGGVLTSRSGWNPPLGETFESIIKDLRDLEQIDLGCSAKHGSFIVKEVDSQILISRSTDDEMLIFLFLNLIMQLQSLGTVPALEIMEYAKVLSSM